jgi:hypothetical protein
MGTAPANPSGRPAEKVTCFILNLSCRINRAVWSLKILDEGKDEGK